MPVSDIVKLIHFNKKWVQFFQDFVAPFYLFTKATHTSAFTHVDNIYAPQHIIINTEINTKVLNHVFKKLNFELELKNQKLSRFTIHKPNNTENYLFI
jgi:hypothetical protein